MRIQSGSVQCAFSMDATDAHRMRIRCPVWTGLKTNPELKRRVARKQYSAHPESKKRAARKQYKTNPEPKINIRKEIFAMKLYRDINDMSLRLYEKGQFLPPFASPFEVKKHIFSVY